MKKIFTLIAMAVMAIGANAQDDTWTVAGTSGICGVSWDPTAEVNDMTSTDGGETFTLVKEGCVLEAGAANQYKIVKNHSWSEAYPSDNKEFTVEETATYTVTFTFVVATTQVSESYVKTGSAVVGEKTWTVCGNSEALFGTEWSPKTTDNDMTKQADGSFKLEKKNVTLKAGEIQYKIAANHAWDESYGAQGGKDNAFFEIETEGAYDVVFTFDPNTDPKTVNAVATVSTGISTLKAEILGANTAIYNLAGQKVGKNYTGIVIQNGRKFVQK